MARRTHCKRGHPLTDQNVYVRPDGRGRFCLVCHQERGRAFARRKQRELREKRRRLALAGALDDPSAMTEQIPGWEGSLGPFRSQYNKPHVYARDTWSGAGNCVCGRGLGDRLHVQAAPGVPIPEEMRY